MSPKKYTKHDTNEKDLYRQLETLVQDHIENQLKHRHNGQQPYKRFSRRPSNTDLHILERHKRRIFGLIQTHVEKYIGLSIYTKNDHSTTLMCNRQRYDTPGGAQSSGRCYEDFPSPAPPARHPSSSQLSQSQNLPQTHRTPKHKTMPVTRMEAARDIQSDVLSVLKRISRFTVDTPTHTLWNLSDHDVIFRYGQLNHFRRLCERAMHSCMDGQKVAPKVPLLECLQMEYDRLLSLRESFQEVLPTRNIGHTPFNAPSGNSTPLENCMNDVLLPTVAAPLANSTDEQQDSESSSDDSSDTSSDSDELQTLTDDSDD